MAQRESVIDLQKCSLLDVYEELKGFEGVFGDKVLQDILANEVFKTIVDMNLIEIALQIWQTKGKSKFKLWILEHEIDIPAIKRGDKVPLEIENFSLQEHKAKVKELISKLTGQVDAATEKILDT